MVMVYHPIPEEIREDIDGKNYSDCVSVFAKYGWDHGRVKQAIEDYVKIVHVKFISCGNLGSSELERDVSLLCELQNNATRIQKEEDFMKLPLEDKRRIRLERKERDEERIRRIAEKLGSFA